MSATETRAEAVRKLASLIKQVEIAMLTTVASDGQLHSRPMAVQQVEFDGDLWFFTPLPSGKTHEIGQDSRVNVAFSSPSSQSYVSVSGTAQVLRDADKAKELWSPAMNAWFPGGLEDPQLGLLKVDVSSAEYWDAPSSTVAHLAGFLRGLAGKEPDAGDHQKLKL